MTHPSLGLRTIFRGVVTGLLLAGMSSALAVEAVGILNDTGNTLCFGAVDFDSPNNVVSCDEATTGDESPFPFQDARFGRDAAAAIGRLAKVGGGEAGFDFTRICMSGEEEGYGACASPPPLPADLEHPRPNDWACLRDNVTGLTFTLGNPRQVTWDVASSTAEGSYIERANSASRCGFGSGWRLPHRREGISFFNRGGVFLNPLDPAYFPILGNNTLQAPGFAFWTADPTAWHAMFQWTVFSGNGGTALQCRELSLPIPCDTYPAGVTEWASGILLVNGVWRQSNRKTGLEGERWQIRDDGLVVTDNATGLMWDRCGWGQSGSTCEGDAMIFPNWADAIQVARIANAQRWRGFHDWRIPNSRELETLVKIDADPSFDATTFPNTLVVDHALYWTSTQGQDPAGFSSTATCLNFSNGTSEAADKVYSLPPGMYPYIAAVRLVRGGSEWDAFDGVSDSLFRDDFDGAPGTRAAIR